VVGELDQGIRGKQITCILATPNRRYSPPTGRAIYAKAGNTPTSRQTHAYTPTPIPQYV